MVDNRFVLAVDDDAFALQIVKMQLGMVKLPFETAVNGQEAYDKFVSKNGSITLVLMDLSMPVMDGFQSATKMRQYEKDKGLQNCKIFAVSGDKEKAIQDKVLECGMNGLIEKPLTAAKINQCQ